MQIVGEIGGYTIVSYIEGGVESFFARIAFKNIAREVVWKRCGDRKLQLNAKNDIMILRIGLDDPKISEALSWGESVFFVYGSKFYHKKDSAITSFVLVRVTKHGLVEKLENEFNEITKNQDIPKGKGGDSLEGYEMV